MVLLGGAGPTLGYSDFEAAFTLALKGVPLVALHRNLRYRTGDGLALDMGAFIVGLEAASGTEIPIVGKPAPASFTRHWTRWGAKRLKRSWSEMTSRLTSSGLRMWEPPEYW